MTTVNVDVLAIDPGGTTGWVWISVLRSCIFADAEPDIVEWDYGELTGAESAQAIEIGRMARMFQGLNYRCGPAVMSERWDADPTFKSTDTEQYSPVRINAMLVLLWEQFPKLVGDATLHFQGRSDAFQVFTDERLKRRGLYVEGSKHIRAATKHALQTLRRARENRDFALSLWPYPSSGMP